MLMTDIKKDLTSSSSIKKLNTTIKDTTNKFIACANFDDLYNNVSINSLGFFFIFND